jgi:hypothetical protein
MDETYRMLGREREADLEREAAKRRLTAQARKPQKTAKQEISHEPRAGKLRSLIAPLRAHRASS